MSLSHVNLNISMDRDCAAKAVGSQLLAMPQIPNTPQHMHRGHRWEQK